MRSRLTGRFSLLILSFAIAMIVFPAMAMALPTDPSGTTSLSPTISSDKADYGPGELVTLTGGNWQPGESVNIKVNDTYGASWVRNVDVTADESGNVTDSFNLPEWFVSDYDVTATGAQSGTATTTFTDANAQITGLSSATVGQQLGYTADVQGGGCALPNGGSWKYAWTVSSNANIVGQSNNQSVTVKFNSAGPATLNVTISGGVDNQNKACSVSGSQSVTVTGSTNSAPVAVNDSLTTNEDTAGTVNVLANDTDANNDTLTVTGNTTPAHGAVSLSGGAFTYTPQGNYNGSDTFNYTISDGKGGTATGTVNVTVTAVNDAPSFTKGTNQTVAEDSGAQSVANWASAISPGPSDESGQTVNFQVTNNNNALFSAQPSVASNGTLTYTPAANANGTATVTVTAKDSGGTANGGVDTSAAQTFTITVTAVDDNPVAVSDNKTVAEDDAATTINVLANDTDIDGGPKSIQSVTQPTHGTVAVTNGGADLTYKPNADYCNGGSPTDNFTYTLNGGSTATVAVTVTCVNDVPKADGQSVSTPEDTPKAITLSGSDVDGNSLTYTIVSGPSHGALTGTGANRTYTPAADYNGSDSFTFKANDGQADSNTATVSIDVTPVNDKPKADAQSVSTPEDTQKAITLSGSDVEGDSLSYIIVSGPSHGTLTGTGANRTYTPAADYNGSDSFTFKTNDGNLDSDAATVSIDVTPVNDKPVAQNGSVTTDEDTTSQSFNLNANDVDGDSLSYIIVSGPSHGTLTGTGNSRTYTPAADYNGSDSFTFKANDGQADSNVATVSITVNAVNDEPVANDDDAGTTPEDTPITILASTLLANDSAGPANESSQTLSIKEVSNAQHGSAVLNSNGSVTFTPAQDFNGDAYFDYTVCDNGIPQACFQGTAKVTVKVSAVNDAPSFDVPANAPAVNEDSGAQSVAGFATNISAGPADEAGQTVSFPNVTNNNNSLFTSGGQPAIANDGTLSYTPAADANGTATVSVQAKDSGGTANGGVDTSATKTFTITVNAVNDEPTAVDDDAGTTPEDTPLTIPASALLGNDSAGPANESGQTLSISSVSNAQNGQAVLSSNGSSVTFTPAQDFNGQASFDYTVCDNGTPQACFQGTAKVTVKVSAVNDAPSFTTGPNQTVNEDAGAKTVANWATGISAGPADEAGQALNFTVTNDKNSLFSTQPSVSSNGTLSYTPAADANGTATVSVTLKDDGGTANGGVDTSATKTFTITVNAVNDAPSFQLKANPDQTVLQNSGAQSVAGMVSTFSAGPSNESTQVVDFQVSNDNNSLFTAGGQPAIDASGKLTYTLASGAIGTATVTVKAHDNGGTANSGVDTSAGQTFKIGVNYKFDGFRQPVDNKDANGNYIYNVAKAGSAIPIKFSLFGNQGLSILSATPSVTKVACPSTASLDTLEEVLPATSNSGLTYDSSIDQYNYVWKTQSGYAGNCYRFDLKLIDNTTHSAYFKFTK